MKLSITELFNACVGYAGESRPSLTGELVQGATWVWYKKKDEWVPFSVEQTAMIEAAWPPKEVRLELEDSIVLNFQNMTMMQGSAGPYRFERRLPTNYQLGYVIEHESNKILEHGDPLVSVVCTKEDFVPGVLWCWRAGSKDEGWYWVEYIPDDARALDAAWQKFKKNGKTKQVHKINDHYSSALLPQENGELFLNQIKTAEPNRRRRICRLEYAWYWKDDKGKWAPYKPEVTLELERAYRNHVDEVEFLLGGTCYSCVLSRRNQFVGNDRYKRRDMLRRGHSLSVDVAWQIGTTLLNVKNTFPPSWTSTKNIAPGWEEGGGTYVDLAFDSTEFLMAQSYMQATIFADGHDDRFGVVPGAGKDPKRLEVTAVQRVENPSLWQQYVVDKHKTLERHKADLDKLPLYRNGATKGLAHILDEASNEFFMFHGGQTASATRGNVLEKIIAGDNEARSYPASNGFDARFAQDKNVFGAGLYFAENSSKSNQYNDCPRCGKNSIVCQAENEQDCKCTWEEVDEYASGLKWKERWPTLGAHLQKKGGPYTMLLCRVMLGRSAVLLLKTHTDIKNKGDDLKEKWKGRRVAPTLGGVKYDSVYSLAEYEKGKFRMRETVLYDGAQVYPEYIIHYRRHLE